MNTSIRFRDSRYTVQPAHSSIRKNICSWFVVPKETHAFFSNLDIDSLQCVGVDRRHFKEVCTPSIIRSIRCSIRFVASTNIESRCQPVKTRRHTRSPHRWLSELPPGFRLHMSTSLKTALTDPSDVSLLTPRECSEHSELLYRKNKTGIDLKLFLDCLKISALFESSNRNSKKETHGSFRS